MKQDASLLSHVEEVNGVRSVDLDGKEAKPLAKKAKADKSTVCDILSLVCHAEDTGCLSASSSAGKKRYRCDGTTGTKRWSSSDVCELCADPGHVRYRCALSYCVKCRRVGHQPRACRENKDPRVSELCQDCPSARHSVADCPRTWRKYKLNKMREKRPILKACPACLSTDHFVDDCSSDAMSFSIFTSSFDEYL
jgi:protein AIR1/2